MSDILELLSDPTQTSKTKAVSVKRKRKVSDNKLAIAQSINVMTHPQIRQQKVEAGKASYKTRMRKIYTWRNLKQYKNLSDEEILVKIAEWEERQKKAEAEQQTETSD